MIESRLIKEFDLCLQKGIPVTIKKEENNEIVIVLTIDHKQWNSTQETSDTTYTVYIADINNMAESIRKGRERLLEYVKDRNNGRE